MINKTTDRRPHRRISY